VTHSSLGTLPHALVVDDDLMILMDAASILEEAGFHVLEASSVAQALDVLATYHEAVQLLFTDVQMPGGADGFELARQTAERWPHIAIVVASGQVRPGPGDLPEGATFIGKPFSAEIGRQHVCKVMSDEQLPVPLKS